MIADRAYDSDPLRERLKKRGIDLIVPYRENNKQRRYEDGRKLRRYIAAGSSNAPTLGWVNSADSLFVMSTSSPPTEPSSTSPASGSR